MPNSGAISRPQAPPRREVPLIRGYPIPPTGHPRPPTVASQRRRASSKRMPHHSWPTPVGTGGVAVRRASAVRRTGRRTTEGLQQPPHRPGRARSLTARHSQPARRSRTLHRPHRLHQRRMPRAAGVIELHARQVVLDQRRQLAILNFGQRAAMQQQAFRHPWPQPRGICRRWLHSRGAARQHRQRSEPDQGAP